MTDMSMPSSADVLWNLPDFLYCLVDQENLNKTAKPDTENELERVFLFIFISFSFHLSLLHFIDIAQ